MRIGVFTWIDWKRNYSYTGVQQHPTHPLSHRLWEILASALRLLVRKCCQVREWSPSVLCKQTAWNNLVNLYTYLFTELLTFNCSADSLMIFLPDESKRTIIPRGIKKLSTPSDPRNPSTLYEFCLRNLYNTRHVYNIICRSLSKDSLPVEILNYVQQGPVTVCGSLTCTTPLFTECHFSLFKK